MIITVPDTLNVDFSVVADGDSRPASDCAGGAAVWLPHGPPGLHADGQSGQLLRNQQLHAGTQNVNTVSNANECLCTNALVSC